MTVTVRALAPTLRSSSASPGVALSSSLVMTTVALASFLVALSVTVSIRFATDAV